jgi:PLP dependent protein
MESSFAQRLENVRRRMAEACGRAGRDISEVRLVAVAKTFGPDAVIEAEQNGIDVIGESRIQEAKQKMALCPGTLQWHMIGHLQTNKCRDAVQMFRMIHSVDSLRLLEAIDVESRKAGVEMPVCIEVNVSGERSKFGCAPEMLDSLLEASRKLTNVSIVGLMTIPPFTKDPQESRPFFRRLREVRDQAAERMKMDIGGLSMGMSDDLEVAIEEGATWVRVGSVLFGARPRRQADANCVVTED